MSVKLVAVVGTREGSDIPVDSPEFIIGRDPSCHLRLEHVCISRRHCRIASEGGRVLIEDLGSAFGIEVNGRKVRSADVRDGDRLRVGFEEFLLAIRANGAAAIGPSGVGLDGSPAEVDAAPRTGSDSPDRIEAIAPAALPPREPVAAPEPLADLAHRAPAIPWDANTEAARPVPPTFVDDAPPDEFEDSATQDELPVASLLSTLEKAASTSFESRANSRPPAPAPPRPDVPPGTTPPPAPAADCVCLIAEGGKAKGLAVEIRVPRFLIGRDDGCHLYAKSDLVSRVHAAIDQFDGRVFARDLGSTNGTVVNDRELHEEEAELADGDRLQVGPLRFRVAIPPGLVSPEATRSSPRLRRPTTGLPPSAVPSGLSPTDYDDELEASDEPATLDEIPVANLFRNLQKSATTSFESRSDLRRPERPPTSAGPAAGPAAASPREPVCLIALDGNSRGQIIELDRPRFLIGRDNICHLLAQSDLVSRIHAILELRDGKVFLRDMASTNGTILNEWELHDEEVQLADHDQIRIGPLHFAVAIPAGLVAPGPTPEGPEPRITWVEGPAPGSAPHPPVGSSSGYQAPPPREAPRPDAGRDTSAVRPAASASPGGASSYGATPHPAPAWKGPAGPPLPGHTPPAAGAQASSGPTPVMPRYDMREGADLDLLPVVDELTQEYLQQALSKSVNAPAPIPEVPQDIAPKVRTVFRKGNRKKVGPIFAIRFFEFWDKIPTKNKIAIFLILFSAPIFAWRGRAMIRALSGESLASRSSRVVQAAMAQKVDQLKPFADPKTAPELMQWAHLVGPVLKRQVETGVKPVIQVPLQDTRAGLATILLSPAVTGPNMNNSLMLFWIKSPKGDWLLDGHSCYLNATSPPDVGRD